MKILSLIISVLFLISDVTAQKINRSAPPQSGPAPVISVKDPAQFNLPNGMTVLVVENHKFPKVSATFSIDRGPVTEGDKAGMLTLMGSMLSEGTTSLPKDKFDEAVDQMGANVGLSSAGGSVSSLTRYFDKSFGLWADALKHPAMEQSSFEKLKKMQINGLKVSERSASAISSRVVSALSFGKNNPMGEFSTEQTLENITLQDVKDAYAKYITPSRSYLIFVGDITPAKAKELADQEFGNWTGNKLSLEQITNAANPSATEIDLVDVPTAVQSEITVTNLINLPMSSPDYFPMLIANQILGGESTARLFMNLREAHGFTYGAYSSVGSGRFQTTFKASASVRNDKADSAVAEIMNEIDRIRTEEVSDTELTNVKALYTGNFALSMESPSIPASFASNIMIKGLDKDFYKNYLQSVSKVTAEDVQRVAQKYFKYGNTRIVVVGKAEAIKSGLEKLGYPVKMYDKYADPVTETANTTPDISAKEVIDHYIQSIGGAGELGQVKTIHRVGSMNAGGMDLDLDIKEMAPNLSVTSLLMGGNAVVKDVFDGTKGTRMQMGQSADYSEEEVKEKADEKGLFNQLFYFTLGFKVEVAGMDKVNGKDAYKLNVTSPAGKTVTEWYDKESGYLVKQQTTSEVQGQSIVQTSEFSNYQKAGSVMIPFKMDVTTDTPMGAQTMPMEFSSIRINEGVTADDFK